MVTFDKDFGELAVRWAANASAGILLLRFSPTSPQHAAASIVSALEQRDDWSGLLGIVEEGRIRIVPLDL